MLEEHRTDFRSPLISLTLRLFLLCCMQCGLVTRKLSVCPSV